MCERSQYFLKLMKENVELGKRYELKLTLINNVDPYLFKAPQISYKVSDFPAITSIDIVTYLVLTTSYYTSKEMKAFKSLNAYKYYEAGFVSVCGVVKIGDYLVLVGKVKHSQKMNQPPLDVWIICQEDGSVNCGHCTCMAGLSEVCSHVEALLYAVEYIEKCKASTSCTDITATWQVPALTKDSKVESKELRELSFSRVFNYAIRSDVSEVSKEELGNALREIQDGGSSSVLMAFEEPFASELTQGQDEHNVDVLNPYSNIYKEEFELYSLEDVIMLGSSLQNQIHISEQYCQKVNEATINQASSATWFYQRTGRITASLFKKSVRTSLSKPSLSLIKSICYPSEVKFKTQATEWGKNHEARALEAYKIENNASHVNLKLDRVGLCLNTRYPQFGASPDAFVSCVCCGLGCVEVKCPYTLKEKSIEEFAKQSGTCLKTRENGIYLDQDHEYFFQIQQQLALTGRNYCDFVIWSPAELFIERVTFVEDFWLYNSAKSLDFHKCVIMPELLSKFYTKKLLHSAIFCVCNSGDDGSPMIYCANNNCPIQWFHIKCVDVPEIPNLPWVCFSCR